MTLTQQKSGSEAGATFLGHMLSSFVKGINKFGYFISGGDSVSTHQGPPKSDVFPCGYGPNKTGDKSPENSKKPCPCASSKKIKEKKDDKKSEPCDCDHSKEDREYDEAVKKA